MTLPPRRKWPSLQPGVYMLSVEFSHSPTIVLEHRYDLEMEARDDAKRMFQDVRSINSIALLGRKADGKTGILDLFSFGRWDSDITE